MERLALPSSNRAEYRPQALRRPRARTRPKLGSGRSGGGSGVVGGEVGASPSVSSAAYGQAEGEGEARFAHHAVVPAASTSRKTRFGLVFRTMRKLMDRLIRGKSHFMPCPPSESL